MSRNSTKRAGLNIGLGVFLFLSSFTAKAVTVQVNGLRNGNGQIVIAAYNQAEGFPQMSPAIATAKIENLKSSTVSAEMDLPPGTYAFSTFHDENMNNQLDTGAFGIPKEGFGFSNSPHITTQAPTWQQCAVTISQPSQVIAIKLQYSVF